MISQAVDFLEIDIAMWLIIAIAAVLLLGATAVSDFRLIWSSRLGIGALGLLAIGQTIYARSRGDPPLVASLAPARG